MAAAVGTILTILSAVSVATKSAVAISKAIEGLRAHYKIIQDLWDELKALEDVLVLLTNAIQSDPDRFSLLTFPLERCGKACDQLSEKIKACTVHSDGSRPSIRDWAKLKYMGSDISGFLRMLDSYKMTISIALEAVNIGESEVSIEHIQSYQKKISLNIKTLKERLTELNRMLESLATERCQNIVSEKTERTQMLEEKASIQHLIDVCLGASQDLENRQVEIANTENELNESKLLHSAKQAATRTLEMCQRELTSTSTGIQAEIQCWEDRNLSIECANLAYNAKRQLLMEEVESIEQQLSICEESNRLSEQKRHVIAERISAGNKSFQIIKSDPGTNLVARGVQVGDGSLQAVGQFSDTSLQQTSRNHAASLASQAVSSGITLESREHASSQERMTPAHESSYLPSHSTSDTTSLKDDNIKAEIQGQPKKRHGIRFKTLSFVRSWGCITQKSNKAHIGKNQKQG